MSDGIYSIFMPITSQPLVFLQIIRFLDVIEHFALISTIYFATMSGVAQILTVCFWELVIVTELMHEIH